MNAKKSLKMCIVILGATLSLPASVVMADMVNTGQMSGHEVARNGLQALSSREEVRIRLQEMGVEESMARDRVAAMTEQEVQLVAQKIDTLPAGGRLHNSDLVLVLVIILLILII